MYEALAPLARRERQVTLTREAVEDAPPVLADRQRLAQILLNLARNAITYTPAGGIVSLAVERPDHYHLSLVVADTGVGIPQEELDRVFERFYRADASRARATGGFGLGLAIVRDLAQAMGGVVTAESVVGQGSRFIVTLPSRRRARRPQGCARRGDNEGNLTPREPAALRRGGPGRATRTPEPSAPSGSPDLRRQVLWPQGLRCGSHSPA